MTDASLIEQAIVFPNESSPQLLNLGPDYFGRKIQVHEALVM